MPWKPEFPGEYPTLGWEVLDWIGDMLGQPDTEEILPLQLTSEQAQFILRFYRLDPVTGKRLVRRGVLARPKGWGKSPTVSALAAVEGMGPVLFDGWDAAGRPVGKPWARVRKPLIQLAAVAEDQTKNAYGPLLDMLRNGPVMDEYPGLEPMETFINLPYGQIEFITAAALSKEGNKPVFAALDQTESWTPGNGGIRLASTIRRNAAKVGGHTLETPNAFVPGQESVAEKTAAFAQDIAEGRSRDQGLLYDSREAPSSTDMADHDSLLKGLEYAYGDSAELAGGWVDLERLVAEIWDPDTDPEDARRFYLNQVTHAADAWVSELEWRAIRDRDKVVMPGDVITLGLDGSRGRAKGKPDATALIGCRVRDGHLFELKVWEAEDNPPSKTVWETWEPPLAEVDAVLDDVMTRYRVVAFYADPAKDWRSWVNDKEARYGPKMAVKATLKHPFEWWMTGGRATQVQTAIESLEGAILNGDATQDGSLALTRHVLNARRRLSHAKLALGKSSDYSVNKIDGAVAAVLAWQARLDAVAAGLGLQTTRGIPSRIR